MATRTFGGGTLIGRWTSAAAVLLTGLLAASSADALVVDFEDFPPGMVITTGDLPPGFTIEVTNNHPDHVPAAIIFDSDCTTGTTGTCTGNDPDLRTPGVGVGNDTTQNHVLIIAEDLEDVSPADGLVDDPDDEGRGGTILVTFPEPLVVESLRITDIDTNETGSFVQVALAAGGEQTIPLEILGNNSGQTIVFPDPQPSTSLYVVFRGSGSIDDIVFAEECGDGVVGPGEECDPPDGVTCDENCMLIEEGVCGDDVINQPSEECDGTALGNCLDGCEPDCTCSPFCGDGSLDPGEECDPPDGVTCDDDCMLIEEGVCGDDVINQPGEECDGTALGDCEMGCEPDCTCTPFCGDGVVDPGEECDPPDGVTCDESCRTLPFCGDGVVNQPEEECDPPDGVICDDQCQLIPQQICGDDVINQPEEECDGTDLGDCEMGCEPDCTCTPFCGDGVVDPGEECDPPNGITCDNECMNIVVPVCGDDEINQSEEECDGTDLGDCEMGCEPDCMCAPFCGDGVVDPGEECDPPDGATCDDECMLLPFCGDGEISQPEEECDGAELGECQEGCDPDCTCAPICGDGIIEPPDEACDPPDGTTCDENCQPLPFCGDGMINQPGEQCDGTDLGACPVGCELDCTCTGFCGDGEVGPGEECDPPETGVEICNNDIDDDGDNQIDCRDPDCAPDQPSRCIEDCVLVDPCAKFIKDPAKIRFDATKEGLDLFSIHGYYHLRRDADLGTEGFSLRLMNDAGTIYFGTLVPGELQRKRGGKGRYVFKDREAKEGRGEADGLFKVVVRIRPKKGQLACVFKVKAYGDLSAADRAVMTTQVVAGANAGSLTAEWREKKRGWILRQRDFGGGG